MEINYKITKSLSNIIMFICIDFIIDMDTKCKVYNPDWQKSSNEKMA